MSSRIIRLPDIGEGITEAEIVEWLVSVGDTVAEDQSIGSVMTDKAAVEIPSPVAGIVEALSGQVGEVLSVGAEYARIRMSPDGSEPVGRTPFEEQPVQAATDKISHMHDAGELGIASNPEQHSGTTADDSEIARKNEKTGNNHKLHSARSGQQHISHAKPTASPAVRRRAYRNDVSLSKVRGSGPAGRILHEDLERHLATAAAGVDSGTRHPDLTPSPIEPGGRIEEIPVIGIRRAIARKMQMAKQRIPHFSYVEEIDVTKLETLRGQLNERAGNRHPRLTLLPFIVLATVRSLAEFPRMNARFDDDAEIIRQYHEVHVGIATQTDSGLMVPVLRQAHTMDIRLLAAAISRLADSAREGKLASSDRGEGTITITSLGALGGLVSTPVINHPEVAIVGVNRIVIRPMFEGNKVVPRQLMNLSCSFDHRVVDGHDAARFVQCIKAYLEFPASLFVSV